jgi:hypothetical protein
MIKGDSKEYEVFEEAIKQLTNPIGATVEIGVRRGMGSKLIIDSFRKHHPNVKLNHLGIVKSLASSISKLDSVKLYEGKNIKELAARGLQLDACCLGLDACRLHLEQLGA